MPECSWHLCCHTGHRLSPGRGASSEGSSQISQSTSWGAFPSPPRPARRASPMASPSGYQRLLLPPHAKGHAQLRTPPGLPATLGPIPWRSQGEGHGPLLGPSSTWTHQVLAFFGGLRRDGPQQRAAHPLRSCPRQHRTGPFGAPIADLETGVCGVRGILSPPTLSVAGRHTRAHLLSVWTCSDNPVPPGASCVLWHTPSLVADRLAGSRAGAERPSRWGRGGQDRCWASVGRPWEAEAACVAPRADPDNG